VADTEGDRASGFDDTIVPVDYETNGQIPSGLLHRHLVSRLHPSSTLFVILDCCHSGSALELPYVYRADADGNINMLDNLRQGAALVSEASNILRGGFSFNSLGEAAQLYAGATDFFRGLKHMGEEGDGPGFQNQDQFAQEYAQERKFVTMFSGCRDDQTSADASIQGTSEGAMSWAFLETMKRLGPQASYMETLQNTRGLLVESQYDQVPQLSVGEQFDLQAPLRL
jgi:hypothetical protein